MTALLQECHPKKFSDVVYRSRDQCLQAVEATETKSKTEKKEKDKVVQYLAPSTLNRSRCRSERASDMNRSTNLALGGSKAFRHHVPSASQQDYDHQMRWQSRTYLLLSPFAIGTSSGGVKLGVYCVPGVKISGYS